MQYQYNYNNTNQLVQSRLYHVNEDPSAVADPESIEDMGVFTPSTGINVSNNYRYDAEGRLIQDLQEGIQNIIWRVDGKVKEIVRIPGFNGAATKNIRFDYDAIACPVRNETGGHRIAKHVLDNMSGLLEKSTYYVLDAQEEKALLLKTEQPFENGKCEGPHFLSTNTKFLHKQLHLSKQKSIFTEALAWE